MAQEIVHYLWNILMNKSSVMQMSFVEVMLFGNKSRNSQLYTPVQHSVHELLMHNPISHATSISHGVSKEYIAYRNTRSFRLENIQEDSL